MNTWILIILVVGVGTRDRAAVDHIEFNDRFSCEVAQVVVQQVNKNIVALCFRKSKE